MWWPGQFGNPSLPYFERAKAAAANVPQAGEQGTYTAAYFQEDFPQFYSIPAEGEEAAPLLPQTMLDLFIQQANESVLPSRWGSLWRYAAGLYVAHFCTIYLKTYAPGSESGAQAAANAAQIGVVKSSTQGDASVSYDNAAITAGTEKWGAWNATQYGQMFVTLARQVGIGGMYVI